MRSFIVAGMMVGAVFAAQAERYEPDWSSLRKHNTPEWLDGMKFGIYCHWGPQTVQHEMGLDETSRISCCCVTAGPDRNIRIGRAN